MDVLEKANLLYSEWAKNAKAIGVNRFLSNSRSELIEELVSTFHTHDISLDDVLSFKRKLKDVLITQEGLKGNGKYKGWKDCLEQDFEAMVSSVYLKTPSLKELRPLPVNLTKSISYNTGYILPRNKLITKWSKHKFSSSWNESVNLLCHTVGHELNTKFCNEVLNG